MKKTRTLEITMLVLILVASYVIFPIISEAGFRIAESRIEAGMSTDALNLFDMGGWCAEKTGTVPGQFSYHDYFLAMWLAYFIIALIKKYTAGFLITLDLFGNWTMPDLRGFLPQCEEAKSPHTFRYARFSLTKQCGKKTAKTALANFRRGLLKRTEHIADKADKWIHAERE